MKVESDFCKFVIVVKLELIFYARWIANILQQNVVLWGTAFTVPLASHWEENLFFDKLSSEHKIRLG